MARKKEMPRDANSVAENWMNLPTSPGPAFEDGLIGVELKKHREGR